MLMGQKEQQDKSKEKQYSIVIFFFALAVFLLPIDWISGLRIFREYSLMSSFYIFLPLVILSFPFVFLDKTKRSLSPELYWFIGLMSFAFLMSFILNSSEIFSAELKGRPGINKVATTIVTFCFSSTLMFLTAKLAQTPNFLNKAILKPLCISMILVFFVSTIELLGRYIPLMSDLYLAISRVLRSGTVIYQMMDGRIRGVSGEPATMAMFMGFALVFSYYMYLAADKSRKKWNGSFFFFGSLLFFFLTEARTAYILLFGIILSWTILPLIIRFPPAKAYKPFSLLILTLFGLCFTLLFFISQSDTIAKMVTEGDSVSNLSRYASNYTAFSLFADSPIFGKGPGQYAFHGQYFMPVWGWSSNEVIGWYTDPVKSWPPIFSLPARLAADLGLAGIIAWYIPLLELLRRLIHAARKEYRRLQYKPPLGCALILGMVYVLLQGIPQESFRFFELWITLGIVSVYVKMPNPEAFFGGKNRLDNTDNPYIYDKLSKPTYKYSFKK